MTYIHIKTGNIYSYLGEVIDCTNSENDKKMVLYKSDKSDLMFVREYNEFHEKFIKKDIVL